LKKTLIFALYGAILLCLSTPLPAAEPLSEGQAAPAAGVFFDTLTSYRLLDELEQCRIIKQEAFVLRELDKTNERMVKVLEERIKILEKNQADLLRMNEAALKNAEEARKVAGGKWYEKLWDTGKWIGLGILVGLAAGG